jgi:hypothetical protein
MNAKMIECWVNVYWYPKSGIHYSHCMRNKAMAIHLGSQLFASFIQSDRKTLYRIRVRYHPVKEGVRQLQQYKYSLDENGFKE